MPSTPRDPDRRPGDPNPEPDATEVERIRQEQWMARGEAHSGRDVGLARAAFAISDWVKRRRARRGRG